jgi:ATP-binding cassette subfamily F protein 3
MEAERRNVLAKELKPLKDELKKVESAISRMEGRRKEIEALMNNPEFYRNGEDARKVSTEYKELESELELRYFRWSELTEEIEKITTRH